jgi:Yip1 domain
MGDAMSLVERAKNIILQPKREWPVIDAEPTTIGELYTRYVILLSAIPPIASFIGFSLFGMHVPLLGTIRIPIGSAISSAIVRYILGLVGVYVLALIIDALAPNFGGQKNQIQALKVAAYSSTAAWVAGIFAIIPALSVLGIVGLYSLFLLYLGLPILMKSPPDRALGYTVVVILAAIVIFMIIGVIASRLIYYPMVA